MITSASNQQVKHVIQLQKKGKLRRETDCFIVEGKKMAAEAAAEKVRRVYMSASYEEKYGLPEHLQGVPWETVADSVFAKMSDTQTPQGILCEMERYHYQTADLLKKENPLLLLLENLQDPGNVGTIFRTAEGAGVDGIILTEGSVDIYHPKTIRSTMGSIYRMPFMYTDQPKEILSQLQEHGIIAAAAHLAGSKSYDKEDYRGGTIFLIGNEGNGLSEELSRAAGKLIRIPMEGQLESLNAAVAAALLMYEAHRQRSI